MGRNSVKNLPPRMRARRRGDTTYYFYDAGGKPRKEIPLGKDYVLAVQQWAKLNLSPPPVLITVSWAIGKYLASADYDHLGPGTRADYQFALDKIIEHFGDAPIDQVRPSHITLYMDKRKKDSLHRAQREVAVFGMIFRWAMAHDWCQSNPAAAIKRKRLPGRKAIDIEDDTMEAVYAQASQPLKDAMDLAYYIGQRPADVLKLSETDIKDGHLAIRQNKTGTPLRIAIVGELAKVIERIAARKKSYPVRALALLVDERGSPMTKAKLRSRFEDARTAAGISGKDFQFRDLRRKSASDLRDQVGLEAAQALLGHASVTMTEHYTAGRGRKIRALPVKNNG
jgi:integrase